VIRVANKLQPPGRGRGRCRLHNVEDKGDAEGRSGSHAVKSKGVSTLDSTLPSVKNPLTARPAPGPQPDRRDSVSRVKVKVVAPSKLQSGSQRSAKQHEL